MGNRQWNLKADIYHTSPIPKTNKQANKNQTNKQKRIRWSNLRFLEKFCGYTNHGAFLISPYKEHHHLGFFSTVSDITAGELVQ